MIRLAPLHQIAPLLTQADPSWCIFGSTARWLSGEAVEPHDVDIMLTLSGAVRAEQLLAPWRIDDQQPESGRYRSRRSHYVVDGLDIDLSGGLQRLVHGEWQPVVPHSIHFHDALPYTLV